MKRIRLVSVIGLTPLLAIMVILSGAACDFNTEDLNINLNLDLEVIVPEELFCQEVTIAELLADPEKYEGQYVKVTGKYIDMSGWQGGSVPEGSPSQRFPWGICDESRALSVQVMDDAPIQVVLRLPNYDEGQGIELRG